ncbi:CidA/LrgA family protein [Brevibacillus thermoruber]|uniref:CidA/LrgA family protein n=1 Tax=Brevibacillus thermoruber TaxID=33942 RepID=UPI00404293A6
MKKWLQAMPQLLLLLLFSWLGKEVAALFHLHVPGSLIGLLLLFLALQAGWVRLTWVEAGAALLFGDMILFFVPAIVGIVQYPWLLGAKGLLVLAVVLSGTALVMAATGVVSERLHWMGEGERHDSVERV